MDQNKQIIKHSSTTQIINDMNLVARKCWNILVANAFDEMKYKDQFEITASELIKMLGMKTKNYSYFESIFDSLFKSSFTINILKKDKAVGWERFSALSYAKYYKGRLTYQFSEQLQNKLTDPEMYVKLKLAIQNKMTSKYSLAIYELCLDYYDRKKEISYTPYMKIEVFKLLILGDEKKYKGRFNDLNNYVIKKAVKEINNRSDLEIKPIFKRYNRIVSEIKFQIKKGELNKTGRELLRQTAEQIKQKKQDFYNSF